MDPIPFEEKRDSMGIGRKTMEVRVGACSILGPGEESATASYVMSSPISTSERQIQAKDSRCEKKG